MMPAAPFVGSCDDAAAGGVGFVHRDGVDCEVVHWRAGRRCGRGRVIWGDGETRAIGVGVDVVALVAVRIGAGGRLSLAASVIPRNR